MLAGRLASASSPARWSGAPPDAGREASTQDAKPPEDAAPEAGEHDAAPEASESDGFVCTPFSSTGQSGTGCDGTYAIPEYFAVVHVSNQSCQPHTPTPAECQCSQTYSCACLQAAGVCAGSWLSCQDGGEVTVTCQ